MGSGLVFCRTVAQALLGALAARPRWPQMVPSIGVNGRGAFVVTSANGLLCEPLRQH